MARVDALERRIGELVDLLATAREERDDAQAAASEWRETAQRIAAERDGLVGAAQTLIAEWTEWGMTSPQHLSDKLRDLAEALRPVTLNIDRREARAADHGAVVMVCQPPDCNPSTCQGDMPPPGTLAYFLLARIAEDEAQASWGSAYSERALAECESKRTIIWMAQRAAEVDAAGASAVHLAAVLAQLARPYADHPGYREEWWRG